MCIRDRYVLVPFLLRVLQLADQLSVSAVARGAERPGVRGSYYEKRIGARDHIAAAAVSYTHLDVYKRQAPALFFGLENR